MWLQYDLEGSLGVIDTRQHCEEGRLGQAQGCHPVLVSYCQVEVVPAGGRSCRYQGEDKYQE